MTLVRAAISTRIPALGERLTILGFRVADGPGSDLVLENGLGKKDVRVDMRLLMSSGFVTDHYLKGRDSVMAPFPCVALDCPTQGGMSGGPAFDAQGSFVGVLSAGFAGGPSLLSLLWPSLLWKTLGGWPAGTLPGSFRLLDLPDYLCTISGREAFHSITESGAVYAPWT